VTAPTLAPRGDLRTLDDILHEIRGPIALALAMNRPDHVALVFHTHAAEIEAAYIHEHDLYPWRDGPITPTEPAGLSLVEISERAEPAERAEPVAVFSEDALDAAIYGDPDTTPIPIRHEAEVA
jgi:hypothetical protein